MKADDVARREDGGPNVGEYPVSVSLSSPSVDKQASRNHEATRDHEGDAKLGAANMIVPSLQLAVDPIIERRAHLRTEEEADAQRNVVQAADAGGFPITGGPEGGEGGENEVHDSIEVCHIQSEDLDDRLRAEELEWTRD